MILQAVQESNTGCARLTPVRTFACVLVDRRTRPAENHAVRTSGRPPRLPDGVKFKLKEQDTL